MSKRKEKKEKQKKTNEPHHFYGTLHGHLSKFEHNPKNKPTTQDSPTSAQRLKVNNTAKILLLSLFPLTPSSSAPGLACVLLRPALLAIQEGKRAKNGTFAKDCSQRLFRPAISTTCCVGYHGVYILLSDLAPYSPLLRLLSFPVPALSEAEYTRTVPVHSYHRCSKRA